MTKSPALSIPSMQSIESIKAMPSELSQDLLAEMAEEALREYHEGKTEPLDLETI